MKTIISYSVILMLFLWSGSLNAQPKERSVADLNNYVVLTQKIPQIKAIALAAEALQKEDQEKIGAFKVIICGKTVQQLTDKKQMEPYLQAAKKANIELYVCGFSLNKFQVDTSQLSNEFKIVENGILYGIQLQKMGYYHLGL